MHALREARRARGLSMKELADCIGICERTVWAAEHGIPLRSDTIRLICSYFERPAAELGLVCQQRFAQQSEPAPKEGDMQRREALTMMAATGGLALLAGTGGLTEEETLTIARTLVSALWRVSLSENVETVAQVTGWLLNFLERKPGLLKTSKDAAQVTAEGHLIAAIAARHLLQPGERLRHLQVAECYARLAEEPLLQKAVYSYLGYSYNWDLAPGQQGHKPQPEAALLCFQRGLAIKGGQPSPAMESSLLTGLAEAYSLLRESKAALKALGQAEECYSSASPTTDPGYALADHRPTSVALWRARVLLNLERPKEALSALDQKLHLYYGKGGRGLADLQPNRLAVALALNDQEIFSEAMMATIEAVRQSRSRYGRAEATQLLHRGQARWPRMRDLADWNDQLALLPSWESPGSSLAQ